MGVLEFPAFKSAISATFSLHQRRFCAISSYEPRFSAFIRDFWSFWRSKAYFLRHFPLRQRRFCAFSSTEMSDFVDGSLLMQREGRRGRWKVVLEGCHGRLSRPRIRSHGEDLIRYSSRHFRPHHLQSSPFRAITSAEWRKRRNSRYKGHQVPFHSSKVWKKRRILRYKGLRFLFHSDCSGLPKVILKGCHGRLSQPRTRLDDRHLFRFASRRYGLELGGERRGIQLRKDIRPSSTQLALGTA